MNLRFRRKGLLWILTFIFTVLVLPKTVVAQSENELLPTGQVIESDYIRAANTIQINGDVKGDAFLTGGVVTINGKIDGDLFIAGGKVSVNGPVGNSVRIIGGDVSLNSTVGRNVLLICGNCIISKEASMSGSLLVAGGNLEVSAQKIGRGFRFFGSRLYLNSTISDEAFVVADREFILGPNSSISGNLKYTGNSEVVKEPGSTVAGTIAFQKVNRNEDFPRFFGARPIFNVFDKIRPLTDFLGFVISAIVGFVLLGLFPKQFEKGIKAIENRPYASLGWGLIAILIIPLIAILLALTIVGLPLSLLIVVIGYLGYLAAKYLTAFFMGRRILLSQFGERRGWALVLGLFLFYLLGLVPIVGNLIKIVITLFGLGGIILAYKQPAILDSQNWVEKSEKKIKTRKR